MEKKWKLLKSGKRKRRKSGKLKEKSRNGESGSLCCRVFLRIAANRSEDGKEFATF